jgi:hypothetical protein
VDTEFCFAIARKIRSAGGGQRGAEGTEGERNLKQIIEGYRPGGTYRYTSREYRPLPRNAHPGRGRGYSAIFVSR